MKRKVHRGWWANKYEGRMKIRWLTLLLRVGTLWRCGDGLFFEVPPLESDALLTTFHPLLENGLQTVGYFEISCFGAPFSWLKKPRNRPGGDLNWILCSAWKKWIGGISSEHPPYSPDLASMKFLRFSNREKRVPRQEISKWSTVCSTFWRSGFKKETVTALPHSSDSE
jgi:hypothetical protein